MKDNTPLRDFDNSHLKALIENFQVQTIADLLELNIDKIKSFKGYGKKRIQNLLQATRDFYSVDYDFDENCFVKIQGTMSLSSQLLSKYKDSLSPEESFCLSGLPLKVLDLDLNTFESLSDKTNNLLSRLNITKLRDFLTLNEQVLLSLPKVGKTKIERLLKDVQEKLPIRYRGGCFFIRENFEFDRLLRPSYLHIDSEVYDWSVPIAKWFKPNIRKQFVRLAVTDLSKLFALNLSSLECDSAQDCFTGQHSSITGKEHDTSTLRLTTSEANQNLSNMIEEIKSELNLKKKAELLKEYVRGNTNSELLSEYLRHEVENSDSKAWRSFCKQIQKYVRQQFYKQTRLSCLNSESESNSLPLGIRLEDYPFEGFERHKFGPLTDHMALDFVEFLRLIREMCAYVKDSRIDIFRRRYLPISNPGTLQEVGELFGVTRERVRQICKKELGALHRRLRSILPYFENRIIDACNVSGCFELDQADWTEYEFEISVQRDLFGLEMFFDSHSCLITLQSEKDLIREYKNKAIESEADIIEYCLKHGHLKRDYFEQSKDFPRYLFDRLFKEIEGKAYLIKGFFDNRFIRRIFIWNNYPNGFALPSDFGKVHSRYEKIFGETNLSERAFTAQYVGNHVPHFVIIERGKYTDMARLKPLPDAIIGQVYRLISEMLSEVPQFSIKVLFERLKSELSKLDVNSPYHLYSLLRSFHLDDFFSMQKYPYIVKKGYTKKKLNVVLTNFLKEREVVSMDEIREEFIKKRGYNEPSIQQNFLVLPEILAVDKGQYSHISNMPLSHDKIDRLKKFVMSKLETQGSIDSGHCYSTNQDFFRDLGIPNKYLFVSYCRFYFRELKYRALRIFPEDAEKLFTYRQEFADQVANLEAPVIMQSFFDRFKVRGWNVLRFHHAQNNEQLLITCPPYYVPVHLIDWHCTSITKLVSYVQKSLKDYDYIPLLQLTDYCENENLSLLSNFPNDHYLIRGILQRLDDSLKFFKLGNSGLIVSKIQDLNVYQVVYEIASRSNVKIDSIDEMGQFLLRYGYINLPLPYSTHSKICEVEPSFKITHPPLVLNLYEGLIKKDLINDTDENELEDDFENIFLLD